jgi:hypothetical protein
LVRACYALCWERNRIIASGAQYFGESSTWMAPCVFHPIKLTKNKRVFIKIKKYIILTGTSTSMSELQKNIGGSVKVKPK